MSKKGIIIGTGIAALGVAAGVAVSHMITKGLVKFAIAREMPQSLENQRPKITQGDRIKAFQECINETGKALLEKDIENVEIKSRDGLRLVGHWYPCENAKRVIVAMHGWRSAWYMDFGMIADFWHNEGCSILFAEQRAQNNSEGEYMTFGYMERYDCLDWIHWVNERTESQYSIYLAGVSMGASTVLMTAGLELPENLKGVIADCGYTSPIEIIKKTVKEMKLPIGPIMSLINFSAKFFGKFNLKSAAPLEAVKKNKIPTIFIHGEKDFIVPTEMGKELYENAIAEKKLVLFENASHANNALTDFELYEKEVVTFISKYVKNVLN